MKKVLVTGGSGFIGTNVVERFIEEGWDVCSIDKDTPRNHNHQDYFKALDILDSDALLKVLLEFEPEYIVHLAARTDLDGKTIEDYSANTVGVQNLINAISRQKTVSRCIFTSSKLVCRTGYKPCYDEDYKPNTLYGESKVEGEKIIRSDNSINCEWCIGRPGSIWGPWFDVPYKYFFLAIAKGRYFHPANVDTPKSFGYVGNVVFQIEKLLKAPADQIHGKTFYWSDYDSFTIRQWADAISEKTRGKKVKSVPGPVISLAAKAGDLMKKFGFKNPPITSFRLSNMRADTTDIPLEPMKKISGLVPYTMEDGVELTVNWLKNQKLI